MRNQGKIAYWNEDKGYGFIQPETGTKQVFVHIRAFSKHAERPALEDNVSYALSTDKLGRPCAVKVKKAGEKRPGKNYSGYVLIALSFLSVVGVSVLAVGIPSEVLFVYLVASLLTFIIYAKDKSAARKGRWRTKENKLHVLALLGGWPGALIAQQTLRHKSQKTEFRMVFWLTVVLNCGIYVWLFTPGGEAIFRVTVDGVKKLLSAFFQFWFNMLI
jgi:uncharacterized membrane protein YsdA (DUF1294 family)/cold shock CspA family protein